MSQLNNSALLSDSKTQHDIDTITRIKVSTAAVPLGHDISDAKVFTGRQNPLREVPLLFVEIETADGLTGMGFSYTIRHGAPGQYAHACELAPLLIGEDPNDISRLWDRLMWAGVSVGRSGTAIQAIAAFDTALWDLKARRARLPLSKLIGAHRSSVRSYNTSGGYLNESVEVIIENAKRSLESGIGGIKMKVGLPDELEDLRRVSAVREALGPEVPLMVDVNQQWDRTTARRMIRALDELRLTWIEEPLDTYDVDGLVRLTDTFDSPIASGEMLSSVREHEVLINAGAVDFIQPDAPRVGGISEYLKLVTLAERHQLSVAPHFVMELHVHLAATTGQDSWVEHFDWLEPAFNERIEMREGHLMVPTGHGLDLSISDQARSWTLASAEFSA
ncbi:mandelate racemase/muconate lactonizing enzyme family protein [Glutamicibacter sp. NPDC087344]|uniref:L-talarate/galactarate dehydratase n=1 Tax=Glutamicibacter sp. NPDC087344 TaxID=3363994 RepID=UPI003827468D